MASQRTMFLPPIGPGYRMPSRRDLEDYQGDEYFGDYLGEPNVMPWRSGSERLFDLPVNDAEYATKLRSIVTQKARNAQARGSAADSIRAIKLFDSMTPDQAQRLYSGAPQSEDEADLQRRVQVNENAGTFGTIMGYKSELQNEQLAKQRALFNRQIRDSDLNYELRQENADRENELFDLQGQRVDQGQQRLDRQQSALESSERRKLIGSAIDAVANGTVHPDDVQRLFPELDRNELTLVRQYGQQYQSSVKAEKNQAQGTADYWNQQLAAARQLVAQGKSEQEKQKAIAALMKDFSKTNADKFLTYDSNVRGFVPIQNPDTSRVTANTPANPFARPTARLDQPVATGPVNPVLNAFGALAPAGQNRDAVVDQLTARAPRAPEGTRANLKDGSSFQMRGGRWVRLR